MFKNISIVEPFYKRCSVFGMPPLTARALAGPLYEPRFVRFMTVVFGGRLVRFLVFGGAATLFADSIDRSIIPAWLAAYL